MASTGYQGGQAPLSFPNHLLHAAIAWAATEPQQTPQRPSVTGRLHRPVLAPKAFTMCAHRWGPPHQTEQDFPSKGALAHLTPSTTPNLGIWLLKSICPCPSLH